MVSVTDELPSDPGGRYQIEREVGRGGMATVYLATDSTLGRRVAMKVLHPDLAAAVGAERFHREIHIASTLSHPHILPVYDSGELNGLLYYVMPFVEGESLRDRLNRERQLSVDDAIRITCEIAGALDHAHAQGIVHRDIKPENIMLEAGVAVLADFGIARVASSAADAPALTQTGMAIGTPAYMSPEQALGEKTISGRSDQYSLACVTYEMLTGEPPFSAATSQGLIARHVSTPVPELITLRPSVSEEVQDVILQALDKVPADRFATMHEFAAALEDAASLDGTVTRRVPGTRTQRATRTARTVNGIRSERRTRERVRRRSIAATIVALAALGAGGVGWRLRHAHASETAGNANAKHVAVLYFQDRSTDKHLAFLADGLTEGLIDRLRDVQTLDVVSRGGVAPFRNTEIPVDSIGRVLKVGTVVRGTVEPVGTGVRVGLQLLDGTTGAEYKSASFSVPAASMLHATDSLAEATSRLLRVWTGEAVQLKEQREQAHDAAAWSLVQQAEHTRLDAIQKSNTDSAGTTRAFAQADSLLAVAEARDPAWAQPGVMRARIALHRLRLSPPGSATRWIDEGLADVERALKADPRSADALELRGTLRFERYARNLSTTPAEEKSLVRDAEADLLRATVINPAQANAWNMLSALYYKKSPPDLAGANINARRALEADAYLAAAPNVMFRLWATSYDMGQHEPAVKWCDAGRRQFATDARFVSCRLYNGLMKDEKPDPDGLQRVIPDLLALTPPARRPLVAREARILAAAPLVYLGLIDSAKHVLAAARAPSGDPGFDPEGVLLGREALIRARLGERAEAVRLIKIVMSAHPQHIAGLTRNTWWWTDLENDPDFKALVGAHH